MKLILAVGLSLAALAAAGCENKSVEDEGSVFVEAGDASTLRVHVTMNECLSATCDVDRSAECSVAREGDRVIVSSRFAWTSKAESACTADCGTLTATCTLSVPLEDGSFVLVHGVEETPFEIVGGQVDELCQGGNALVSDACLPQ